MRVLSVVVLVLLVGGCLSGPPAPKRIRLVEGDAWIYSVQNPPYGETGAVSEVVKFANETEAVINVIREGHKHFQDFSANLNVTVRQGDLAEIRMQSGVHTYWTAEPIPKGFNDHDQVIHTTAFVSWLNESSPARFEVHMLPSENVLVPAGTFDSLHYNLTEGYVDGPPAPSEHWFSNSAKHTVRVREGNFETILVWYHVT